MARVIPMPKPTGKPPGVHPVGNPIIPPITIAPLTVPTRQALNATATTAEQKQATVAALDALLPIPYGRRRLGALLANVVFYQGQWAFWLLWGLGPVSAIESITMNDQPLPTSNNVPLYGIANYLGTTTQGIDPTLAYAFAIANQNTSAPPYTETLPGICYSVIRLAPSLIVNQPVFNAVIAGRVLYDPRLDSTNGGSGAHRLADSTTWEWSQNPALQLADFLRSPTYGDGKTPDWPSVITTANACDVMVGEGAKAEKRRVSDFVVDAEQTTALWLEAFRAAAGCWLVPQGDTVKLIPDVSASASATYDSADGTVLGVSDEGIQGSTQLPTIMEISYTDTSVLPWRDAFSLPAKRPGVDAGTVDWRKSTVPMPWITRGTQANREAIERINKLWLRSMTMTVEVMDEGLKQEPGDVVALTYPPSSYSALQLRVTSSRPTADGWALSCTKEDPGAYSDSVVPAPQAGGIGDASPDSPPQLDPITVTEDVYQVQTGLWGSRLRISWTAPDYPYIGGYLVTVKLGDVIKDGPIFIVAGTSYLTKDLTENLTYTVSVSLVSTIGAVGPAAIATITNNGKQAKPSDVPSITGFEVGGEVRLTWVPATDLDLTAHELRYGSTGSSWASATLLDRVATPAVRYSTKIVPAGTWRFFIKGLDSVRSDRYPFGQESDNAAYVDIDVTSDASAYVAGECDFVDYTLAHMSGPTTGPWVTDFGTDWATLFPNAMSTYTDPLASYFVGVLPSRLQTDEHDFGALISGDWAATISYENVVGTADLFLDVSEDANTWTALSGGGGKATARYARLRVVCDGGEAVIVRSLGHVHITAVTRRETGTITTSATLAATVTLSRNYAAAVLVTLTPMMPAQSASVDNIQITGETDSFDVYAFNSSGAQVAASVMWVFEGI